MKKSVGLRKALVAAKVYVSDASDAYTRSLAPVLRKRPIPSSSSSSSTNNAAAALVDIFTDVPYCRTNLTVVGSADAVAELSLNLALRALRGDAVPLSAHRGTHPRVGVVDHVAFHPLDPAREAGMPDAMRAAESFAERLRAEHLVPVFVYGGDDHPSLVEVRKRRTDFFKDPVGGMYEGIGESSDCSEGGGGSDGGDNDGGGRSSVSHDLGVTIVGACPWVTNYNLLLETTDLRAGRKIARRVRAWEGFGKGTVQTMALAHEGGKVEIACNVLDAARTGLDAVQDAIAKSAELELGADFPAASCPRGYVVGELREEDVVEMAKEVVAGTEKGESAGKEQEQSAAAKT